MAWDIYLKNAEESILKISSIRTRLTLFYTIAAFILLTLVTVFLYWVTINILYKADYQFLSDEIDNIQYILDEQPIDKNHLKLTIMDAPRQPDNSIYRYYIRIFDENKKVYMETPGMDTILQAKKYSHKHSESLGKKRYFWFSHDDTNYLLAQAPIELGNPHKVGLIQIALDISYQHAVINDRKKLIYSLLIGTLFALIIGFFVAHRGIRSLFLLTKTVEKITATSLNQRIDPKSWPKELWGLSIAFNQMLDRIENSFTRLKQFSADLSHELRTPITNLIGETEVTLSYANTVPEYQQVLASNLEELHRISSLIENILFLARAENPHIELHKSLLYVHDEIASICEYYQAMAEEKHIEVSIEGQGELYANAIMFKRMISNIFSNSIKYTPQGGNIKFTISRLENGSIEIKLTDSGIGIAQEHLPNIFNRFYRTDAARSQHSGGMGLGLAIVKSIVDLHQGSITIASTEGKGTTITLIMPSNC